MIEIFFGFVKSNIKFNPMIYIFITIQAIVSSFLLNIISSGYITERDDNSLYKIDLYNNVKPFFLDINEFNRNKDYVKNVEMVPFQTLNNAIITYENREYRVSSMLLTDENILSVLDVHLLYGDLPKWKDRNASLRPIAVSDYMYKLVFKEEYKKNKIIGINYNLPPGIISSVVNYVIVGVFKKNGNKYISNSDIISLPYDFNPIRDSSSSFLIKEVSNGKKEGIGIIKNNLKNINQNKVNLIATDFEDDKNITRNFIIFTIFTIFTIIVSIFSFSSLFLLKLQSELRGISLRRSMGSSLALIIAQYYFEICLILIFSYGVGAIFASIVIFLNKYIFEYYIFSHSIRFDFYTIFIDLFLYLSIFLLASIPLLRQLLSIKSIVFRK
ncbi:MAG: FtsX-like permease family protein [Deinococcaceae bacterium]